MLSQFNIKLNWDSILSTLGLLQAILNIGMQNRNVRDPFPKSMQNGFYNKFFFLGLYVFSHLVCLKWSWTLACQKGFQISNWGFQIVATFSSVYVNIPFGTQKISFFSHQGLRQALTLHISENICLSSYVMVLALRAKETELYHKLRASICRHVDDFVALNISIGSIPGCCQRGEGGIGDTEPPNTTKRHWKVIVTHQDKEQWQTKSLSKADLS